VLAIGYIVATIVKKLVVTLLEKVGLDKAMHSGSVGQYVNKAAPDFSPSKVIGAIAFWFIFLGAISIAVSQLGIAALTDFVASIAGYLPNVVAAILIFVIAGAIAAAIGGLVARTMGDTPTGKVVGSVVPVLVMAIATFMILNQLRIAPEIVTITYGALIGGVFLAMALAFGLGGREVAAQMLGDAYDKGREQRGRVKDDMQTGKERAKDDAQRVKAEAETRTGAGNGDIDKPSGAESGVRPLR
jgi:Conserved TM helix